jgi:hypothetical protein
MLLNGSCKCGAVAFTLQSDTPYPYLHCYCTICRKIGAASHAINISGHAETLSLSGEDAIVTIHATIDGKVSNGGRRFCGTCGSPLWMWDSRWDELIHPFASAIDTPLPPAPERVHIMLAYKAPWVEIPNGPTDRHFDHYPDESLEQWHRRHGLYGDPT